MSFGMTYATGYQFESINKRIARDMLSIGTRVHTKTWHAVDISRSPAHTAIELTAAHVECRIPETMIEAQVEVRPNLPWAEDHFLERVSGEAMNPPPSHVDWPFAEKGNARHTDEQQQFSHTYPERYWPKFANIEGETSKGRQVFVPHVGVRFEYGDLADLIIVLGKDPLTRQAYLPVWFPEDLTAAVEGQRVPCSLGYQVLIRGGELHVLYHIRSCDFVRHFRDDVYHTMRLAQWIREQIKLDNVKMGRLIMTVGSLHAFEGDRSKLEEMW